ncbi:ribose ABC transporter permease [Nonomuraea monospora]|uniref:Ribose ABC transporter permease n=1 Tax=Nonomuraea monospora TaxID=568818 RepID=A0ABP5PX20_9ACTN
MINTDVAVPTDETAGAVPRRRAVSLLHFAERYALVGLLIAVAVFFTLLPASSEVFPTPANLRILAAGQSVTLLIALAALIPLVAGQFDFSAGAVAAASSVTMAGMMAHHDAPLWACVVAALALGLAVGLVNGIAVSVFGMNSFVITLAVATLLGGGIQWYTQGRTISNNISPALIDFGSLTWAGIPRVLLVVTSATLVIYYLLDQTPYGRSLRAIGDNPGAARLVGMPVARYGVIAFAAGGVLAALAGLVLTARIGGATADNGTSMIFPALAAVFLGATAIQPGRFNLFGTVVGVALVAVSVSGLTLAGAADWVNPVFNGAALAIAVAISTYLARRSRRM